MAKWTEHDYDHYFDSDDDKPKKDRKRQPSATVTTTGYTLPKPGRSAQPLRGCERCKQDHVRKDGMRSCLAHRRNVRPLAPCKMIPARGAWVCRLHGGSAPQVQYHADNRAMLNDIYAGVGAYFAGRQDRRGR